MKLTHHKRVVFAAALCMSAAVSVSLARADTQDIESRVNRIESQTLVELLTRLDRLQNEAQQLRGQLEEQAHNLDGVQQRQKDMYLELDGRLRKLEQGGVTPPAAGEGATGETADSATPPATGSDAAGTSANTEQGSYQQAFDLLKKGQYPKAIQGFHNFIGRYPDSSLANNAQYWLGEANYVAHDYKAALVEFRKVIDSYPHSSKIPDALLKIGFIHYEQSNWDKARAALSQVKSRYPDTSAARLADERLRKMKTEKH